MRVLAFLLVLAAPAGAQYNDWDKAIAAVSKSATAYEEYALAKSGLPTMQNLVGVIGLNNGIERHKCAILGRMLGRLDEIAELEQFDYPPLNDRLDPYEAGNFAMSLHNWVGQAQWAVAADEADRINTWNLDCAGHFGIPVSARVGSAAPEAQFEANGQFLTVYGDIDKGFHERFMAALDAAEGVQEIVLGSGGGSVRDALLAGREIRRRGLRTTLHGNCYSACPLVFAAGTERTVWANVRHDFGFHRLSLSDGTPLPDDHPAYGLIAEYLTEMDVDAGIYLGWMKNAPPSGLFTPEPDELCDLNLATFVQRICLNGKRF